MLFQGSSVAIRVSLPASRSFHVTVRDADGRSNFIRAEIGLLGATYSVILTDAGNFPPPFRDDRKTLSGGNQTYT